jgi:hypothetical protein
MPRKSAYSTKFKPIFFVARRAKILAMPIRCRIPLIRRRLNPVLLRVLPAFRNQRVMGADLRVARASSTTI